MKEFYLEVLTPSSKIFEGQVLSVTLSGTMGEFQILYDHAPMISTLEIGRMKIRTKDQGEIVYSISNGVAEVMKNKVLVLVRSIEDIRDIDLARAEKALDRAKKRLSNKNDPNTDFPRAEVALQRAINRIKLKSAS